MTGLNEETRQMVLQSAQKFIQQEYTFSKRRLGLEDALGYNSQIYTTFGELGWLGIPIQEEFGGSHGSLSDMAELAEEFGRGLIIEPWFSSVALCAELLKRNKDAALSSAFLEKIAFADIQLSLAWEEQNCGSQISQIATKAKPTSEGYELNGHKTLVLGTSQTDTYLIVARRTDNHKLAVFSVAKSTPGLRINGFKLVDGTSACELHLDQLALSHSQLVNDDAENLLSTLFDEVMVLLGYEALGCMEKLLEDTVEYAKTRKQFGVAIGQFQTLRHMLADMFVILQKTRCFVEHCLQHWRQFGSLTPTLASQLKVQVGRASHKIGRDSIQIHGGVGMTDELEVGHYVKRLTVIDALFGNSRIHLNRLSNEQINSPI